MIHSFRVTIVGIGGSGTNAIDAVLDAVDALIDRIGGAGARFAGDPADGIDTAGDAILRDEICRN